MRASAVVSFRQALLAAALALLIAGGVQAGTLTVQVTQAAGQALADAVALLEPKGGRPPAVKPLAGVQIAQAKRQFSPRVTVITVGTSVSFPNFDTVRHQVYSFSEAKRFELQLYAGVPQAPVLFDKPGIAVLGCNIHDKMSAWVVVSDTPWFAQSAADGQARIDGAPPGSYVLRVWHPALPAGAAPLSLAVVLDGSAHQRVDAQLAVATD
jgi:plastocyanin